LISGFNYELSLRDSQYSDSSKFALGLTASRRESKASFEANDELASPRLELMKKYGYQRCSFSGLDAAQQP